jgi:hypothetical protein
MTILKCDLYFRVAHYIALQMLFLLLKTIHPNYMGYAWEWDSL